MLNRVCVKCGHEEADVTYVGDKLEVEKEASMFSGLRYRATLFVSANEFLLMTCPCCKREWVEKTLDAQNREIP